MSNYISTKVIELGSCAFRQWRANHSHCRFLHGYQLKAKIWFGCKELDNKNWAVDFGGLKDLKKILQNQFDHTTIVAKDDPELDMFKELDRKGVIQLRVMNLGVGIERVAEWVFSAADVFIKAETDNRCWVDKVEVFEHENNSAMYSAYNVTAVTPQDNAAVSLHDPDRIISQQAESITVSTAARVGPNNTPGKTNWFSGTRWG